jgi:predicted RNase H-like nuclease (RuvC/YqgF family)
MSSRLAAESSFAQAVEMIATAKHNGKESVPIDVALLNGLVLEMEDMKEIISALRNKYTGAKVSCRKLMEERQLTSQRTSQQYSEGLTVAGEEYDKELAMRKDLEAEVSRLRAQVHTQTARLSVISGDERRAESMRRRSDDLAFSLTGLEKDISRLRAERDMTLAEVEELKNSKRCVTPCPVKMS